MGKAKKGRKDIKDEEVESDIEEQHFNEKETSVKEKGKRKTTNETAVSEESKKTKKKKGKSHSNDNSDVEDLSKEVEDLEISKKPSKNKKVKEVAKNKPDSDVSDDEIPSSKPTNKKNQQPRGGFALLEVESGPEDIPEPDSDEDVQPKKSSKKQTVQKQDSNENKKEAGGKKSKKKKRRKDSDEEDLEKVFAELEMEYSGIKKEPVVTEEKPVEEVKDVKKKEKKKKNEEKEKEVLETVQKDDEDQEGGTVKTAAQKKKEKKEREKAKRQAAKKQDGVKKQESGDTGDQSKEATPKPDEAKADPDDEPKEDEDASAEGKKKKKGAKAVVDDSKTGKGPGKKTIAAMQEALKKMKEEEERLLREEEERIKREEEAETARLEQLRLEQERKEKKKQKEKERKERQRKEGKLLTAKQKADRARAQAMLEALKAQGVELPEVGEKKIRPGTRVRPSKLKQQTSTEKKEDEEQAKAVDQDSKVEVQIVDQTEQKKENEEDDVKDAWDAESSEDETSEKSQETPVGVTSEQEKSKKSDKSESESDSEDGDDSEEESGSEESEEDDRRTDAEKKYLRAKERIQKRREEAEKKKTLEDLRAAVVCVLGHVDTGKTKILDKLRRTNVQDGEAGGITQQIGATNVPIDAIKEQIKIVKGMGDKTMKLPGLLIIDTPGHESFSNLRSRGSSLCDIAILVVDIMHGLEPQTIESINLLKQKRTPFVVALNKIDRLYDWETMQRKDIRDVVKAQASHTQLEFEKRTKEVILQFAEQSLNAALFYENPDPRSYVSLVPTSAVTGEGMGNLLALIVDACQSHLAKRLMYSEELQATVLEVKAIPGLGTTIDAILVNGVLREGDTMLLAGTDGPIVTQIRSLLMPQPMRELRVKNAYEEYKEIKAAQGVKIAAKELEKAIAGLNLVIARYPDEVEVLKEEVAKELKSALSHIKLQERGVFVQASTLGSLEALLDFLKSSKIPYAGIRIGPVVKKDVMKASIMLEHDSQYATILAFDVKIERDAQDLADNLGVKIFQADIIYHLFDKFTQYREELKQRKRDEFKHVAVFPCKLRVLPQFVFNSRDPIVCGVMIEAGIIREGTPICVPSKEFVELGIVTSIESNHKQVETARKGQEVCIKIEPVPGEAPKMFGRHFDETDMLISKISRQSIDACKDYFRDDLIKTDWQLMVELKKMFQIL